ANRSRSAQAAMATARPQRAPTTRPAPPAKRSTQTRPSARLNAVERPGVKTKPNHAQSAAKARSSAPQNRDPRGATARHPTSLALGPRGRGAGGGVAAPEHGAQVDVLVGAEDGWAHPAELGALVERSGATGVHQAGGRVAWVVEGFAGRIGE